MPASRRKSSNATVGNHPDPLPGFFRTRRSSTQISQYTKNELRAIIDSNDRLLAKSSKTLVERITTHQDQVKKRLKDLEEAEEIDDVTVGIRDTSISVTESISATDSMDVDNGEPPKPKPIRAKQRALNCYSPYKGTGLMQVIHHEEASRLEQERTEFDKERQQEREKRRSLQNPPPTNEKLSREEMADRINRFMSNKTTESDIEDDSDSEGGDPAGWFHDEEDDGVKGQPIVQPDDDSYKTVISINQPGAYVGYSTFFEPRDDQN